ncbi:hypothetical protein [Cohnella sp.]|uniref:hypothetical protein n=1 Tax=Cohnella sp. TaxID=1883426 RepID=UPI003566D083
MENAALLSPTDINIIRRYVHTKYAPLPGDRRAEIVADAIRRTLKQRLPNVPLEMKNKITDELISRCLVGEQRDVNPEDVLDLCAQLEVDEAERNERLVTPILDWARERAPGRWSPEQLTSRLERRKLYTIALAPELTGNMERNSEKLWFRNLLPQAKKRLRGLINPKIGWVMFVTVIISAIGSTFLLNVAVVPESQAIIKPPVLMTVPKAPPDIGMPEQLRYAEFDADALKTYLKSRDALLAEEPYFGAIVQSARKFDVHPLLLFAITGQEQAFVPKSSKDAKKIANNPFNVFHSWEDYNTDIQNSADIASRLLVKLANSRPEGHEPFNWFNNTYAEDPLWSDGVKKIFNKLSSLPPSSK